MRSAAGQPRNALELGQPSHSMIRPDGVLRARQSARFVECTEKNVDLCAANLDPEQTRTAARAELPVGALRGAIARRFTRAQRELLATTGGEGRHGSASLPLALGAVADVRARRRTCQRETDGTTQATAGVLFAHRRSMGTGFGCVKRKSLKVRRTILIGSTTLGDELREAEPGRAPARSGAIFSVWFEVCVLGAGRCCRARCFAWAWSDARRSMTTRCA